MTGRLGSALCMFATLGALGTQGLGSAGCSKKASPPSGPPPELTGLAVVPASAEVVVGAEVAKLVDSPVIDRAVEQVLRSDVVLSERWQRLQDNCKIDVEKQIKRVMLALGPARTSPSPGTGPVLMVAVGTVPEAELKECVTRLVGAGGGTLTGRTVLGRTLYQAKEGSRTMYFAYTRPDTVVLGADEAYVIEALGTGKKASDNPELASWRKLVNQNSPLWAVGRTEPRIRDGLVQLTEGKISAGPIAFAAMADLSDGAKLQLSAVMSTREQANNLKSYVNGELALMSAAAQLKSLGAVVGKIAVTVEDSVVQFRATLSVDDLNLLLSALDEASTPAQDRAPPHPSAGSGAK